LKVYKKKPVKSDIEQAGDLVVFSREKQPKERGHAVISLACRQCRFENVVLYASNSFSFYEDGCERMVYSGCKFARKTDDKKVAFPRLRSGNADGLHSKSATVGPTVENCEFQYTGDDCIAINGRYYMVFRAEGAYIDLISDKNDIKIDEGDRVQCVKNNGVRAGEATVLSLENLSTETPEKLQQVLSSISIKRPERYKFIVRLQLDVPLNAQTGDVFCSLNRVGSGFSIKNCKIGHNRSRGMVIKASDGIISHNEVTGTAMSGIVVSPEFNWMEAGCSENLEISHNTIRNCMFQQTNRKMCPGALAVVGLNGLWEVSPAGVFSNISIHDNLIEGCPRPCLGLTSVDGLLCYSNTILPDENMIREHGIHYGSDNSMDIWTKNIIAYTGTSIKGQKAENNYLDFASV
jgi:hypothetical protein